MPVVSTSASGANLIPLDERKSADNVNDPPLAEAQKPTGGPTWPEGGRQAWGVVLGCMIVNGCSFGYSTTFGIYQTYYEQNQLSNESVSNISWIGSIQVFFMFAGGFVSGPLFDRFGARVIMIPGTILYVAALMLTSICHEYYQFILAQGVLGGIANGFIFSPALACIGHYFKEKRGMAMGLVAVGSSIGGVIFPIVMYKAFFGKVGFAWGVRAVAFVMLGLLAIACYLIKERFPPRKGAIFAPRAFLQLSYMLILFGTFLLFWGVFVVYFFISDYAIAVVHMGEAMAIYLLSIINAASLFGRVFFGAMGDKVGLLTLLTVVVLLNGVMTLCWTAATTHVGLIVWSSFFGFTSGGIFALFSAGIISVAPGPHMIGTYLGQAMVFFAISALTGSPIAGQIIPKSHGWLGASLFAGISFIVGAIFIAAGRLVHEPRLSVKA